MPRPLRPEERLDAVRAAAAMPPGDRLLQARQVADVLSVGLRTLWRMVAEGRFPPPHRFTRKLVRWHAAAVREWLDALRRPPAGP